jgi:hypothetical protein
VFLPILKLSQVQITIRIDFHSRPKLLIIGKLPLINLPILTDIHPMSMPFLLLHLSKVYLILVLYQLKV